MAPIPELSQDGNVLSPRRTTAPDCIGWDCLSESAQAGVIITVIICAILGYYLWHKLGNSEDGIPRRSSMASNLAVLARLSRPGTSSDRRQSHRLSGSIYRRSQRFSGSIFGQSQSRPTSLSSIRGERSRQAEDTSNSSRSPHVPRARHVESIDLTDQDRQLSAPIIPPPPGPAPVLWMGGPTPIFILPPAYTPTPSNGGNANEARYSLVADYQVPPPPHMIPFQYGPNAIPRFYDGLPPNDYPQGPSPQFQQALQLPTVGSQTGTSILGTAERPAENRRRTWFPFMKGSKRPGHGRSISESALPSRQIVRPAESSDLRVPSTRECGRNRLQRQPSIQIIDRSPSPEIQNTPRPYPRIGWRNQSPDHNLHDEDDQTHQSEEMHSSEVSFPSVGTSMKVHDGITSSETTSSVFDRDPHFEEYSPEIRRQRSLKMFRNPTREGDSDADEEESTVRVYRAPKPKRLQRRKLYSSWMQMQQPSPPSSDIQFPSPESQRATFVEPTRRERDGLRVRERWRREKTPAPRGVRERSGEREVEGRQRYDRERSGKRERQSRHRDGTFGRVRERSAERAPSRRQRERSRERFEEQASTRRHRERSPERSDEDTPLPRHRNRPHERGGVQRVRENHPNLLERLRAVRAEMRGEQN